MTIDVFLEIAVVPALGLLPSQMGAAEAQAMIVAIALQESGLRHRRQTNGPARSYVQFERSGVDGVLRHPATAALARNFCLLLDISAAVDDVYSAIEWNDIACAGLARLNLWTSPSPMPGVDEPGRAWHIYETVWRPGRPRPETWNRCYEQAWAAVVPGYQRGRQA